jgi:hypothetical protein
MRNEQIEIQNADLSFEPPLYKKTKKWRHVFLSTPSERIYRGIRARRSTCDPIDIPMLLILENRPELGDHEVSLSDMTKDLLQEKIREKLLANSG